MAKKKGKQGKKNRKFQITGRVIDRNTKKGVPGLKVEAWDKDLIFDDFIGKTVTDEKGKFIIEFTESHFKDIFLDRRPDLFFNIYEKSKLIKSTEDSVLWNVKSEGKEVVIEVDFKTSDQIYKINGRVMQPDGSPVKNAIVKVFDKGIEEEIELGETTSDKEGYYEIQYDVETFKQIGSKKPDLVVRAYQKKKKKLVEVAYSSVIYNAQLVETVDLIEGNKEYKGPSEYKKLLDTITPLLQDVELADLTEEHVAFLSGKTGIEPDQITHLVIASRHAKKSGLPQEIFYGLFRQNFPIRLPALLAQNTDVQKRALEAAVKDNIIPGTMPSEQVLERFQQLVVDHAFEPLEPLPSGKTTFGELIGTVQLTPTQQREFLDLYVNYEGPIEGFWQELEESDFQSFIQELQYTLQLAIVTGNYLPLVEHIKQMESITCLRDLAGLELDDWKGMIEKQSFPPDVPGKSEGEKVNNYAQTIVRIIEDAFPSAVFAHKLRNDTGFAIPFREMIGEFLVDAPEFELGSTQIDTYLKENPGAFAGVEDEEGLIQQLKTMDRLFRVTPHFERYEAVKVLMENGFNSAQSIALMGQSNFASQYAERLGNYWKAKAIYNNALQMTAMTLALHARYNYAFNQPGMYVLPDLAKKVQNIPDWKTLFGSFELCDCKHCESVLSPSAYLVDLLYFLLKYNLIERTSGPYNTVNSAFGVLTDRRRDIARIQLSCENTNTPVPYVDLANEILENAVAYNPEYYQTTGTADELSSNPEHLNVAAYNRLAEAIYPWHLPFNLWTEEARTYLKHLGVPRYKLMETFQKNGENPEPDDLKIATEYLGLTTREQEIITDSPPSEPWLYWGFVEETVPDPSDETKTINWVELLQRVPIFLEKSGLTYKEMEEFLDTRFINPGRFEPESQQAEIEVCFEDAFCNVDEATITNLTSETLNKIHRFVRLWRKINWSTKELDIVLSVLKNPQIETPEIDEDFLLKLWRLHRLHTDIKVPIVNLLSFWSSINTDDYKGQIKSLYDKLFLNKSVLNPEDEIFILNDERNELENPNAQITDYAAGIQAAIEIRDSELSLLLGLEWLFNISWDSEVQTSLNNCVVPEDLLREFIDQGIQLSENREVQVVKENSKWQITDGELLFTIRRDVIQEKFHIYAHRETVVDDVLNLTNLSRIYRIVTLSKALKISIGEFLSIKKLTGTAPFFDLPNSQHLRTTLKFVEKVQKIRKLNFNISELDYLLRHIYRESEGIALSKSEIALILGEIRDELQKIAAENKLVPDPTGELTAMKLTWLKWDKSLIQNVIGTLDNSRDFVTDLTALPGSNFEFPEKFKDRIYFDSDNKKLHFAGLMSADERKILLELSGQKKYQKAIKELFEKARTFIAERTKAYELPPFSAPLENFPPQVIIPDELKDKIYYDENIKALFFIGWMTETERDTLIEFLPDCAEAIDMLFQAPFALEVVPENRFLNENDISKLLKASNISSRFEIVVEKLLFYIRYLQSVNLIIQKIADSLKLDVKTTEQLLTHYVTLPADYESGNKAIEIFLSQFFTESNPNVEITFSLFPEQFNVYILLHKIALIITKLGVTVDEIPLLFQGNPEVWGDRGWADLNFLPLSTGENSHPLFNVAEKLFDLFTFRDLLLPGEPTLFEILNMAFNADPDRIVNFLKALSERTRWSLEDLQQLVGWFGFDIGDFLNTKALVRFMACFEIIKRLGVSAEKICDWISIPQDPDEVLGRACQNARTIKQAAKAKYDNERWLEVAKPLRDDLREKQRSALVSYLIAHYAFRDKVLKNSNELYSHFLIDPEMSPCMMTSRLKLAISTVQLFIQRCLMNLEDWEIPNAKIAQEWSSQWEWMKNYRVWEANRKIFLYPENWIEPELRDDKSPFFEDLENELLQNEITSDNVEKAFLNYLEKLDEVGRLEICGMYHEVEKEAPNETCKNTIDVFHVFGRTRGIPHIYYYRRRIATGGETIYWTPWETVDLDIEGDHLIPVVWNRRLHLFWPIFTGKENKEEEISKYWEIQIAWSEYKNGKWTPNKVSKEKFKAWYYDKTDFLFKIPFPNSEELFIDCLYWCKYNSYDLFFYLKSFKLTSCEKIIHLVFDSRDASICSAYNLQFIPPNTRIESMTFLEDGEYPLILNSGNTDILGKFIQNTREDILTLSKTPGTFIISYPHQFAQFVSQAPFFFTDDTRTFFVTPQGTGVYDPADPPDIYEPNIPEMEWKNPNKVQPEQIEEILPDYFEFIPPYEHWEEMLPPIIDVDPPVVEETFPSGGFYEESTELPPDNNFYNINGESGTMRHTRSNTSFLSTESTSMAVANSSFATPVYGKTYLFETFYHPYVCEFAKKINRDGIDGLLQRRVQLLNSLLFSFEHEGQVGTDITFWKEAFIAHGYTLSDNADISIKEETMPNEDAGFSAIIIKDRGAIYKAIEEANKVYVYKDLFEEVYEPEEVVDKPYPYEDVDFELDGAYSLYNWEIFFHTPLMVADSLSKNQKFAEAQKWFHYIFDPTDTSTLEVPQKYWKLGPFLEASDEEAATTLEELLTKEKEELEKQVNEWKDNPFRPHFIARMRIIAYQKTVVMKYIDNLIAWGDQLFRRDTIESINEAVQLYILAAEILGKRPEDIPPHTEPPVKTFNDLVEGELDAFSNAMVYAENFLSPPESTASIGTDKMQMLGPSFYLCDTPTCCEVKDNGMLYFCIPKNEKLLSYWDTVADRLFKIRHCMTIEGVVRQLPLFEPPIEPGLLVRAVAAGVDINSALNDLNAPLPHYRFQYMLQKAIEFCADVKNLGSSLLSTLEKRDAEELSLLRSRHEVKLLEAVKQVRKQQISEAKESLNALNRALEASEIRYEFYKDIDKISEKEKLYLKKLRTSQVLQSTGQGYDIAASIAYLIPDFTAGLCAGSTYGGSNVGSALRAYGGVYNFLASIESYRANRASILAGYDRRWNEWKLQEKIAVKEVDQNKKQILAAEIRLAMAEKELENHNTQIENAREIENFMKDKFTNKELYNWMTSQISTVYFQSYQMAYDMAKRAEKAFQHELGEYDVTFIKFGYWDSLKKGLLSGEKLHYDLKRVEKAYLDKNKREYEITKHISVSMLDPVAFIKLKETGECFVNLPEDIFDIDYPGHYMRRIKAVRLTIPCVTGPYTSVNCTLTLLSNTVRRNSSLPDNDPNNYARAEEGDDPRFRDSVGAIQSIATSSGQNDSGVFELNFRDERYLPFEGAGAISNWRIKLPKECNNFDFNTISDVILHINYTAREGGTTLKQAAMDCIVSKLPKEGILRMFSAKHEFSNEWAKFLSSEGEEALPILELDLNESQFPYIFRDKEITLNTAHFFLKLKEGLEYDDASPLSFELKREEGYESGECEFEKNGSPISELPYSRLEGINGSLGKWYLEVANLGIALGTIENILIVFEYSVDLSE